MQIFGLQVHGHCMDVVLSLTLETTYPNCPKLFFAIVLIKVSRI